MLPWAEMLIAKGKVPPSEPWKILEPAIGQAPDVLAIRLSKELKKFCERSAEILVPMRRNSNGDAEWLVEQVYVRGFNGSLGRLAKTPGIDFIRPEIATQEWIHELMKVEQSQTPKKLEIGSFVRILAGPCSRLCGNITKFKSSEITVTIQMRTKRIKVYTIAQNLQLLECPPEDQNFFYQAELLP